MFLTRVRGVPFRSAGVRVHRSLLLPAQRPPDADEARHHSDAAARAAAAEGVAGLLRAHPARPHLDTVRRRAGSGHLQVQVRRHGGRGVRLSIAPCPHPAQTPAHSPTPIRPAHPLTPPPRPRPSFSRFGSVEVPTFSRPIHVTHARVSCRDRVGGETLVR